MLHRVDGIFLACLAVLLSWALQVESQCPAGLFGPDCRYECHCEGVCNTTSGQCDRCRNAANHQWYGPTCQLENKAYDKPTTQSSTANLRNHDYISRYAVDGNADIDFLSFSCTLTEERRNPWWRVDLGHYYYIQKIEVFNTAAPLYKDKLPGFEIYISNSTSAGARKELCYRHPGGEIGSSVQVTCNLTLSGQFVTVQQPVHNSLTLCEVKVFVCAAGSHGPDCGQLCGQCVNGRVCHPITGECPDKLCAPGWTRSNCKTKCRQGSFGYQCQSLCGGCRADTTCDPVDGRCHEGCADGRKSQFCNVSCDTAPCVETCGRCRNREACDIKYNTGVCPSGCEPGWITELCNVACAPGLFGEGCQSRCGNCKPGTVCQFETGECPEGCNRGWVGSKCDTRDGPEEPEGSSRDNNGGNKTGVIVGCVIAAIVILATGLLVLLYYKRKNDKPRDEGMLPVSRLNGDLINGRENPGLSAETSERSPDGNHNTTSTKVPPLQLLGGATNPAQISAASLITISPIPVDELKDFIQTKNNSEFGFEPEFGMLPVGMMTYADMGTLPFNRPKNRFQTIIPYDYNRIILDTPDGDPLYQYINASYVDGYKKGKAYIIAQAPVRSTSFDFWRMIWQEDVGKIVMITKLVEAGKVKSEQYWSDFDPRSFGSFVVQLESSVELADFTLRTFLVYNAVTEEQRTIKHFHFTSWPDHGVPRHPLAVLLFRKKVTLASTLCSGPMVVHCSAGIGRSGCYIALDMLIQQAAREKQVDVYNTVVRLRQQRANLIPSVEQYTFLYEALLEAIWFEDTSISEAEFQKKYHQLTSVESETGRSKLQDQFELLESVKPVLREAEIRSALIPENVVKNRHQDILAGDQHRPFLSTHHPGTTDYINAVKIPSYRQKTVFFVTEVPLPFIVMDFWRLVYDHTCSTIVLLGDINLKDKACGVYWPEEIGTVHMERFQVELASTTTLEHNITERQLKLNVLQGIKKERMVKQFHFPDWALDQDLPESRTALLYLIQALESWQQECGSQPVIIQCLDGCRCSGVFCAIYLLLERLQIDREVDVFSTVRLIRDARPQFIKSLEQYKFCYDALWEHIAEDTEDTHQL